MASPFLYCGIDNELANMANELANLGGGSARIENADVYAIIDVDQSSSERPVSILRPLGSSIGLQDHDLKHPATMAESMRYFNVKSTAYLKEIHQSPGFIPPLE